jgi:hypothetical protein
VGEGGNGEVRGGRPKSASDEFVVCDLDLALPSRSGPSFAVDCKRELMSSSSSSGPGCIRTKCCDCILELPAEHLGYPRRRRRRRRTS